ncbi:MAG: hypothetical protein AABM43_05125 [Actinomycetota bacterium]
MVDNLRAWGFVHAVRDARGMGPASLDELRKAVPFDGERCVLAISMGCLTDNDVMVFPTGEIAAGASHATGMRRCGPLQVALPEYMHMVGVAFDHELFDCPLLIADPLEFRRREFEDKFADRNVDVLGVYDYLSAVRSVLSIERPVRVSERIGWAHGAAAALYALNRLLGCFVCEPEPEYVPGAPAIELTAEQTRRLCDAGLERGVSDVDGEETGCGRLYYAWLPTVVQVLAAAIELGELDPSELEFERLHQLESRGLESARLAESNMRQDREVLAGVA